MKEQTKFQEIHNFFKLFEDAIKSESTPDILNYLKKAESIEDLFLKTYYKRKKEGVFYTANKLSNLIISESILLLLQRKIEFNHINNIQELFNLNPKQKSNLINFLLNITIYDPACGSGIFLLNSAKFLYNLITDLDKHLKNSRTKSQILMNIFGQDINENSIKLCILKLFNWFFQDNSSNYPTIISNIKSNLKVGNSLTSPNSSKFDILVGNPPYGNILSKEEKILFKKEKIYNDIYCAFLIKALDWSRGIIGLLVPKSFLLRQGYLEFRNSLLDKANIIKIFDIGSKMFKNATNEVQIVLFEKKNQYRNKDLNIFDYPNCKVITYQNQQFDSLRICLNLKCPLCLISKKLYVYTFEKNCPYCESETTELNRIRIKPTKEILKLIEKIENSGDLNYLNPLDFPKMIRGEEDKGLKKVKQKLRKDTKGSCFFISARNDFSNYTFRKVKSLNIEEIDEKFLKGHNYEYYFGPRLLIKHNNIIPEALYTKDNACFTSSIYSLLHYDVNELKYLCAALNSSLIQFYCIYAINNQKDTTINLNQYMIRHLPLIKPNKKIKFKISENVDKLTKILEESNGIANRNYHLLLVEIDEILFELYGISESEKKIIISDVKKNIKYFEDIYGK